MLHGLVTEYSRGWSENGILPWFFPGNNRNLTAACILERVSGTKAHIFLSGLLYWMWPLAGSEKVVGSKDWYAAFLDPGSYP